MIRALPRLLICFVIPFLLYAIYLLVRQENPLAVERWTRRVLVPLSLAGLGCALAGLVAVGLTAPRYEGGYMPAHLESKGPSMHVLGYFFCPLQSLGLLI